MIDSATRHGGKMTEWLLQIKWMWSLYIPASFRKITNKHKYVNVYLTLSSKFHCEYSSFSPTKEGSNSANDVFLFQHLTHPSFLSHPLVSHRLLWVLRNPFGLLQANSPLLSLSDQSITPNCSITPQKVKDGEDVSVSVCKQTQTGAIKSVLKEDVSGGVCLINPK